jgi:hypothetical protein
MDELPEDWWSTENVATFLGVGTSTIRAYVTRHQMPQPDRYIGRTRSANGIERVHTVNQIKRLVSR